MKLQTPEHNSERKLVKLSAADGKLLYEGYIIDRNKQTSYDGAGYLFNNETKCFFKGTWSKNQKVCGIETFPNGDVYEGNYQEGKFHGMGLLYNNIYGRYRYEGQFENGRKHGFGKEEYITGGMYEGFFKDNLKHGEGKLTFADQSYYMGDFFKGLPNGFGLHVAYSKSRIVSVFPLKKIPQQSIIKTSPEISVDEEIQNPIINDEITKNSNEYYYEGEFVDGYKHGIGRLFEPSGSYYYGYWEYNKPVRRTVFYNADEHNWKMLELPKMVEDLDIDFYSIFDHLTKDIALLPTRASGYPEYRSDGYKSLIDEKGLKREHFEDPDFDFTDNNMAIMIKDESGSALNAPVDNQKIQALDLYKKGTQNQPPFRLFFQPISPGCLKWSEQYCCQQLTTVLDAMTYHSYLYQKIFTRKYDPEIGFYILKFYFQNEWKEYVIDDLVPVFKNDQTPIFSNTKDKDLGFVLIFKAFAKMKQKFTYFEDCKTLQAENLLNTLTGMPVKVISISQFIQEEKESAKERLWRRITEKHQKTQVRIVYLRREFASKQAIPYNFAYQIVDTQESLQSKIHEEDKFLLIKSMSEKQIIKTEINDPFQQNNIDKNSKQAIDKMKDHNPSSKEDPRYFVIGFEDFIQRFDNLFILAATRYNVPNSLEIQPKEDDKFNNEIRMFVKFSVNLPSSMVLCVTQSHLPLNDKEYDPFGELEDTKQTYLPIRIVLAKEKDLYTNKSQIKKSVTKQMKKRNDSPKVNAFSSIKLPNQTQQQNTNKIDYRPKPFRYVFGRGQKKERQIMKEITLESGVYILLIQVEGGNGKESYYQFDKLRFWMHIYAQSLIQIEKIPMINNFQKMVYETAILNAEKYMMNENKEPKFFSKVDLSERENGSTDLVIIQYFLKNEGTYLQYLRNKSTNKIWRQKLYFRTENMAILDQTDASKVDLQLPKKENKLVIIQQVGAKPYNLEGGEGICIIDIQNEKKEVDDDDDENPDNDNEPEETKQQDGEEIKKQKFGDAFQFGGQK